MYVIDALVAGGNIFNIFGPRRELPWIGPMGAEALGLLWSHI